MKMPSPLTYISPTRGDKKKEKKSLPQSGDGKNLALQKKGLG